jgi:hypothetical protein
MAALKEKTAKLGTPKIEGTEEVGGKEAPALYFGSTKMNNNFTVVDEIAKEGGRGMAATLFAKNGDEYIRVATNVPMPGGEGAGDWNCSGRSSARGNPSGQSILWQRPDPWHPLYHRL